MLAWSDPISRIISNSGHHQIIGTGSEKSKKDNRRVENNSYEEVEERDMLSLEKG